MQVEWFKRNQLSDGTFPYQITTSTGQITQESNIASESALVRQLFALHTLTLIYSSTKDRELGEVIEKNLSFYKKYLKKQEIVYEDKRLSTLRIASQNDDFNNSSAFLLLSLIEYSTANPQKAKEYQELIYELGNYLTTTQLPSGGFSYRPADSRENVYNNGESFYALARLTRYSKDQYYSKAVERAAKSYFVTYKNYDKYFYTWAMKGYYELYLIDSQKEYWTYMKNQTDQFLRLNENQLMDYFQNHNAPAPQLDIIVYVEGVLQTAILAQEIGDTKYSQRLQLLSENSLLYISSFQINSTFSQFKSKHSILSGSICLDPLCKATRVDMNSHALAALFSYFKLK